jgi:hypothetical protein
MRDDDDDDDDDEEDDDDDDDNDGDINTLEHSAQRKILYTTASSGQRYTFI